MTGKKMGRSTLFLLELVLAILLLGLCAAWCTRLFATAKFVTEETRTQDEMARKAESLAELFYNDPESAGEKFLALGAVTEYAEEGTGYVFYYDDDWKTAENREGSEHELHVVVREADGFSCITLSQEEKSHGYVAEELFSVEKYREGRRR